MALTQEQSEAVQRSALEALRAGDAAAARAQLERLAEQDGAAPWLLLAHACSMLGDAAGEEAALQRQLDLDKRDLPALLAMGELKGRQGDDRAASGFLEAALRMAAATPQLPAQFQPLLERARGQLEQIARRQEAHLLARLEEAGLADGGSPRMRQAIDLLLGRTPLYLQQPSMFYFPGLPQRAFYEREEFPWLAEIEARLPALRDELLAILAEGGDFEPYVVAAAGRPAPNNPLLGDPSWGAYYFWQSGAVVAPHAACCPQTMAALALAPMPVIAGRSPIALYSLLKPSTHIAPHHGMLNTRLICHVPLVAPDGCALRVGSETRPWIEGEALVFDDSFEHEAWNRSDRTRVVLLFEIWRPEIGETERSELTCLFESIDLAPTGEGPDG